MKRLFDVIVASALLVVTAPITILVALAVKIETRGPVFYEARRAGIGGAPFTMYKFRTMVQTPEPGPRITARGDGRITRVGRFLRATKLDEVPQLVNVLKGDMSLVGPRPEDPFYVGTYSQKQRQVLSLRPGVTGPAVIAFRHEEQLLAESNDPERTYVESILPAKLEIDLEYVDNHSFRRDLRIIRDSLRAIVRRHSSDTG